MPQRHRATEPHGPGKAIMIGGAVELAAQGLLTLCGLDLSSLDDWMLTNRDQPHLDCTLGPEVRPADGSWLSALSSLDLGKTWHEHAWPDLFNYVLLFIIIRSALMFLTLAVAICIISTPYDMSYSCHIHVMLMSFSCHFHFTVM